MKDFRSARKQKGAVLALFAIGMLAIIALAGLALDMSHAYVDKTQLQNALDAAALSGAMTLITSGGNRYDLAEVDAVSTYGENVAGTDLKLPPPPYSPSDPEAPFVEFSPSLATPSWTTGGPGPFVRVRLRGEKRFAMPTWLARVLGPSWEEINIGGSAVAGPAAADTCNLAPFVACGDMDDEDGCFEGDSNKCWGFNVWNGEAGEEQECYLKGYSPGGEKKADLILEDEDQCGAQSGAPIGTAPGDLGTGSFYLAKIPPGCSGANCIKEALRDDFEYCYNPNEPIYPKTGDNVAATRYYNTKFGEYDKNVKNVSRTDYPPDEITTTVKSDGSRLYYDEYKQLQNDPNYTPTPGGKPNKRVFGVLIADCTNPLSGSSAPINVKAVGCFFGTRIAEDGGNEQAVWGEFLGKDVPGCLGTALTKDPTTVSQKIILYKDIESGDS